jgi:hypothetical protein
MKKSLFAFLLAILLVSIGQAQEKYRVIILSDMTHDDGNSLIRYLYYGQYFDTEAIIVTPQLPDFGHNDEGPWLKTTNILTAYKKEYSQLKKHSPGLPDYDALMRITKKGRGALPIIWLTNEGKFDGDIAGRHVKTTWGEIKFEDWIGEGTTPNGEPKDSEGSELLLKVFEKDDDRPIYVQSWGGPITFVQALYRYKQRNSDEKFKKLLSKLHIYSIILQDITFDYLISLDAIRGLNCVNMGTVQSTFSGERVQPKTILLDQGHFWKYIRVMNQKEVNGHGAMSAYYDHGGEGDTPAFLYLISGALGLNDPQKPGHGSWGNMFFPMGEQFPEGYYSACNGNINELERWIPDAKNSFLNRLLWSVKDPADVNHEPHVVINRDKSNKIIYVNAEPGSKLKFNSKGTTDPMGSPSSSDGSFTGKPAVIKGILK